MFIAKSLIIVVYVNDLLLFSPDKEIINKLKERLLERFKMTNLGPI